MKRLTISMFISIFVLTGLASATFGEDVNVRNAIKAEGARLNVVGWGYWGLPEEKWIPAFEKYVKEEYGANVTVKWSPTAGSESLAVLKIANAAGREPPYDVYMTSRMWAFRMKELELSIKYFPDPLMSRMEKVPDYLKDEDGHWVNFQATSTFTIIANKKYVSAEAISKLKDLKDLANPAWAKHLVLFSPTNSMGIGTLVAICKSLGLDYHKPEDVTKTLEWIRDNLQPLMLQWVPNEGIQDMLMEREEGWVLYSNPSFYRYYKVKGLDMEQILPASGLQNRNGMALIAKDTSHPTLAKIWLNWILGPDWTLQKFSGIKRVIWFGAMEGVIIPDFWADVPEDAKPLYLSPEELKGKFYEPDWDYIASQTDKWVQEFQSIVLK